MIDRQQVVACFGGGRTLGTVQRVRFARIRLCLTEDRDADVAAALIAQADAQPREVATVWWDVP